MVDDRTQRSHNASEVEGTLMAASYACLGVQRIVGVQLQRPSARFLEVEQEVRDEYGCEAAENDHAKSADCCVAPKT